MREHSISFPEKGRTKQSHRDECDINTIMRKFEKTGMVDHLNKYGGKYGDFTMVPPDYQAAVELVRAADEMFHTIPAKVRAAFNNDAGHFLAFVSNPENLEKMREMGLTKEKPPEIVKDPPVMPPVVDPTVPADPVVPPVLPAGPTPPA